MIWLIARKEIYDNWQSGKTPLAFALCVVLLVMSVWLGLQDYYQRVESHGLSRKADASWVGPTCVLPRFNEAGEITGSRQQTRLVTPVGVHRGPSALSVLAQGLEERLSRPVQFLDMTAGLQAVADIGNKQERNKLTSVFPAPDFLFVTKVVLSLLTVMF